MQKIIGYTLCGIAGGLAMYAGGWVALAAVLIGITGSSLIH